MAYLLDANVFIQARNLQYGFDFCPAFWDWLYQGNNAGTVFSIQQVGAELEAGGDDLSDWASARGDSFFLPPDNQVLPALPQVSSWATTQNYEPVAVNTFLQVADFYLIAHAMAGGHVVVTHEVASPSVKRIKIPNVCIGLGLRFMTPFEMLRTEQARFVLGRAPAPGVPQR